MKDVVVLRFGLAVPGMGPDSYRAKDDGKATEDGKGKYNERKGAGWHG
jgi:hypothetical protein